MPETDEPQTKPTWLCQVCRTEFDTRNKLFRHLRAEERCAKDGGLAEIDEKERSKPPPSVLAPERPKPSEPTPAEKKVKDKVKEHKQLQIECRPESYDAELQQKVRAMEALFHGVEGAGGTGPLPSTEIFASPPEHYRMRAEFDIWYQDGAPCLAMSSGKDKVVIPHYPMGHRVICDELMPGVLAALGREEALRSRLFQVNFTTTLRGESLVALLYRMPYDRAGRRERNRRQAEARTGIAPDLELDRCPLTDAWEKAATELQAALGGANVNIVGRCRGIKREVGHDWVEEQLEVAGVDKPLLYRQLGGFFSQPNAKMAEHMLAWARTVSCSDTAEIGAPISPRADDLLELYCGNANFSIALAPCFRRVLATELVKGLVDVARLNAEKNGITNLTLARVSSEELAEAMDGIRTFERLKDIDLASFELKTVLVDPPRAGLGPQVSSYLTRFPRIVYISCNPQTMREDFDVLRESHEIRRIAAFDQFPYTDHLEMGALLVRRDTP